MKQFVIECPSLLLRLLSTNFVPCYNSPDSTDGASLLFCPSFWLVGLVGHFLTHSITPPPSGVWQVLFL
jgi:hypothetical protein